jgi:hypothetical protein
MIILPSVVSCHPKLMFSRTNTLATPLIDSAEETSGPITIVGSDKVAFLLGSGPAKSVALASLLDRRLIRRIPVTDAASIGQLASSADGETLYYVSKNTAWEVSSSGGDPRAIAAANSIAVDPYRKEIILQRIGPDLSGSEL